MIIDVWTSLKLAAKNFFWLVFLSVPVLYFFDYLIYLPIVIILFLIQSIVIYLKNCKYVVDIKVGEFSFPRSDLENSIFQIITFQPYWDLMRRRTVKISSIENIYLDTQRWTESKDVVSGSYSSGKTKFRKVKKKRVLFNINVTGEFGSANFKFVNRQKRDELRNALEQTVKRIKGAVVDKKVSELNY
ncbi:hypothetical protein [Rheinheimera sp. WS51]|uniref:hypothetical protein n=1 Tax=Rheinheimera sp. WS51 TaxID=3425886 RepID=UPI003D8E73A3